MTEKEYNSIPGVRRSDLWRIKKSPKHFMYELEHPPEPTPALVFGTAVHCAVLTPELFDEQYWIADVDGRTKEGKAAKQAALDAGKILLTTEQAERIAGMAAALKDDPFANRLLTGKREEPHVWTDMDKGVQCKCRTDCETDINGQHYVVDLKTCGDAGTEQFMRDAIKYGYHVQAAMYTEGVKANTGMDSSFVFVAIEKDPPYAINILECDNDFMLFGTDEYRYLLGVYALCKAENRWPGYAGLTGDINALGLPAWLKKGVE